MSSSTSIAVYVSNIQGDAINFGVALSVQK
jgi:hypothetical protein